MMPALGRGLAPLRHTLDNGAVVIVQETAATPAVAINATFLAGSLYEPEHLAGLAYLTGRVIDRGTERRRLTSSPRSSTNGECRCGSAARVIR